MSNPEGLPHNLALPLPVPISVDVYQEAINSAFNPPTPQKDRVNKLIADGVMANPTFDEQVEFFSLILFVPHHLTACHFLLRGGHQGGGHG